MCYDWDSCFSVACFVCGSAHRPLGSSFLGLPYRILNINHKKELLRGLWVESAVCRSFAGPQIPNASGHPQSGI